ncbi:hypothetical protein HM1_3050 [Heliomicrobium modesticaldum Ice1]|uniref:Uncharacterized protein n=1 Tax=Heliobacterium modesticaldum (strain ATCC 51547 / Ice1) TaxID=498761 RepID=B0TDN2_HELMI|nr:hypothetical protein HM1_3050 [Heliomicrobium modesticaldum Ice1]
MPHPAQWIVHWRTSFLISFTADGFLFPARFIVLFQLLQAVLFCRRRLFFVRFS